MASQPAHRIGIFDSGIGGLSVLRAVQQRLPGAHLSYIADSLHTPWGDRPTDWITARCLQLAGWLIDDGAGLVLVACNTGTTQAMAALRAHWPGHRFVGVEPGIKPAVAASRNHRVAVLATTGTLRSARLRHLVDTHADGTQVVQLPCPGLADAIEAAGTQPHALQQQLATIAQAVQQSGADTVVLGCTHYPLVADALQQLLGPGTTLVDTADAIARRVASLVGDAPASGRAPGLRLFSTANPADLTQAARRWLQTDAVAIHLALPGDATTTPLP
jgi:glutamate racemase